MPETTESHVACRQMMANHGVCSLQAALCVDILAGSCLASGTKQKGFHAPGPQSQGSSRHLSAPARGPVQCLGSPRVRLHHLGAGFVSCSFFWHCEYGLYTNGGLAIKRSLRKGTVQTALLSQHVHCACLTTSPQFVQGVIFAHASEASTAFRLDWRKEVKRSLMDLSVGLIVLVFTCLAVCASGRF